MEGAVFLICKFGSFCFCRIFLKLRNSWSKEGSMSAQTKKNDLQLLFDLRNHSITVRLNVPVIRSLRTEFLAIFIDYTCIADLQKFFTGLVIFVADMVLWFTGSKQIFSIWFWFFWWRLDSAISWIKLWFRDINVKGETKICSGQSGSADRSAALLNFLPAGSCLVPILIPAVENHLKGPYLFSLNGKRSEGRLLSIMMFHQQSETWPVVQTKTRFL